MYVIPPLLPAYAGCTCALALTHSADDGLKLLTRSLTAAIARHRETPGVLRLLRFVPQTGLIIRFLRDVHVDQCRNTRGNSHRVYQKQRLRHVLPKQMKALTEYRCKTLCPIRSWQIPTVLRHLRSTVLNTKPSQRKNRRAKTMFAEKLWNTLKGADSLTRVGVYIVHIGVWNPDRQPVAAFFFAQKRLSNAPGPYRVCGVLHNPWYDPLSSPTPTTLYFRSRRVGGSPEWATPSL